MSNARIKTLSALLINISAAWFGIVIITPVVSKNINLGLIELTTAMIWGIITYELAVQLEEVSTKWI